jgi:hypothetical protein
LVTATGGQSQNVTWAQRYEYDRYGNRSNVYSYVLEDYAKNEKTMKKRTLIVTAIMFGGFCSLACPPPPPFSAGQVTLINDGKPPTFEFKAHLNVEYIHIVGPYSVEHRRFLLPNGGYSIDGNEIWSISPPHHRFIPINSALRITYGQLPPSWEQDVPKAGAPPPLVEGSAYYISANLNEGRRIKMCVLIQGSKTQPYHGSLGSLDCDRE